VTVPSRSAARAHCPALPPFFVGIGRWFGFGGAAREPVQTANHNRWGYQPPQRRVLTSLPAGPILPPLDCDIRYLPAFPRSRGRSFYLRQGPEVTLPFLRAEPSVEGLGRQGRAHRMSTLAGDQPRSVLEGTARRPAGVGTDRRKARVQSRATGQRLEAPGREQAGPAGSQMSGRLRLLGTGLQAPAGP